MNLHLSARSSHPAGVRAGVIDMIDQVASGRFLFREGAIKERSYHLFLEAYRLFRSYSLSARWDEGLEAALPTFWLLLLTLQE